MSSAPTKDRKLCRPESPSLQVLLGALAIVTVLAITMVIVADRSQGRPVQATVTRLSFLACYAAFMGGLGAVAGWLQPRLCTIRENGGPLNWVLSRAAYLTWLLILLWLATWQFGWLPDVASSSGRAVLAVAVLIGLAFVFCVRLNGGTVDRDPDVQDSAC